ncbi:MAG: hypothetical protein K0A89_12835 [ANME-2 cluster archaeon]|nr:hypothetical protein [ANME-2 cluster archaeon]
MCAANSDEVKKIKRKCVVLNVMEGKAWRNVVVQDLKTKDKYMFGKVKLLSPEITSGDELYIGYEELPYDLPDGCSKIILMALDGLMLDWAMITPP